MLVEFDPALELVKQTSNQFLSGGELGRQTRLAEISKLLEKSTNIILLLFLILLLLLFVLENDENMYVSRMVEWGIYIKFFVFNQQSDVFFNKSLIRCKLDINQIWS